MALNKLFKSGIALPDRNAKELEVALREGKKFFSEFNEARMQLAFSAFTVDMKRALYEIIYFLHVNDPRFSKIEYRATKVERISGIVRETEYQATTNLYFPDTLHGVAGIDKLPLTFRDEFNDYVKAEFGVVPTKDMVKTFCPVVSISSLGSIGTIGHKPQKSDLDLQLLYELRPFKVEIDKWPDERLKDALQQEIKSWIQRLCIQRKLIPRVVFKQPKLYKELKQKANLMVAQNFPYLYQYLFQNKNILGALNSPHGRQLKMNIILEMIKLITQADKREHADELQEQEAKLKERILAIQDYIQAKFPKAEVYLFACSCESFRNGQHGTTLESKEASGSAYELILNYEVLVPGIQFAPTIPTHFIISKAFNNSVEFYERIINFIRFRSLVLYHQVDDYVVDMGNTPALKMSYMLSHVGAAYWESFKAASGNLPKALLNLFRIEVLYDSRYLITLIEIIKDPNKFNELIYYGDEKADSTSSLQNKRGKGLSVRQVTDMEKQMPLLLIDPWWLKYKVLKVFYSDPLIPLEPSERRSISRNIDLCFALHIKLSHAFNLTNPRSHRERFLKTFLEVAFPPESPQRATMERIFMGEIQTINHFEKDLKNLFANCLDRIHRIIAVRDIPDGSNQSEFEIWYHYYQQNFDNAPNEISKNILAHLKVPRSVIRVRFEKSRRRGNWVFTGDTGKEKGQADGDPMGDIPQNADLTYEMSFLKGLAYCILNGYYGLLKVGTLREAKSKIDIDIGSSDLGNVIDNHWAIIDSETAARLSDQIVHFFPYKKTHYMDCVRIERKVTEVFFFLHLFKFARLSVLYRDNLQAWRIEEYDHPDLALNAQEFYDKHHSFLQQGQLHESVHDFLKENEVDMTDKELRLEFWYNYMSTGHAQALDNLHREKTLSWQFKDSVMKNFGGRDFRQKKYELTLEDIPK